MKYIYLFLIAFVFSVQSSFAQGNTNCADDQANDISGVCALCSVSNPDQAVDGNPGTYSTLQTTLGLLGTDVSQTLIFSDTGAVDDIISLVIEDPSGLLDLTLGGNLEVETYLGTTANGDAITISSGVANVISGTSRYRVEFPAGADFDRVRITLSSGVVSADLSSVRVYSACYTVNEFPPVCVTPVDENNDVSGLVCLCSVSNPGNAIDGDEDTYSTLSATLSLLAGSLYQEFEYSESSCVGEEVKMIIENPGGLLSASLLGNVSIELRSNSGTVLSTVGVNFNNLELLGSSNKYIYRFTPSVSYDRIRVVMDAGILGALSGLRIYEVCKNRVAPPAALRDTILACSGNSVDLSAVSAPGTTIQWYNASSGGTLLHSGEIYSTPSLTSNTTYYLQTEVDSSGCTSSSRSEVYVEIVPDAPAPVLTQSEYTVYEGDGVTINPGPSNVDFNFFSDRNGATTLHTGSIFTVEDIFTDTTIYVQSNLDGCLSDLDSVVINIVSRPNPDDTITAASYCADTTEIGVTGVCASCGVFNAENATDGNDNTYSTIQTTLGLLGAEVYQDLIFDTPGHTGDIVTIVVEDPAGLLSATLGSNMSVATYQGSTSNGDEMTVTTGVLSAIASSNKFIIEFPSGGDFDRVRISLASGALGVDLSSIRVYSVCYRNDHYEPICNIPVNQSGDVNGLLCVLCGVEDGINAIDGDEDTYSQLNVNVGLAASVSQTFTYGDVSCIGEELKLILENPSGLLDVALLGNVDIELLDASNTIVGTENVGISNLTLLNGSTSKYIYRFAPSVPFQKLRIRLNGGLVGALASLRIYEVCRNQIAPPLAVRDTVLVCDGNATTLHAQSAAYTSVSWWDAETGGTELGSGKFFQTPVLTANTTYYLQSAVDTSGCISPSRVPVYVEVVPEAPAPVLAQSEYTVYEGDGVTINPGPSNVDFNFYNDRNGATILHTGSAYAADSIFTDTTIYVQTNLDGCLSDLDSVVINIVSRPNPDDTITAVSYCADTTESGVAGVCASCGVFNAENAIDGNDNTYSTIQTTLGLLGTEVYQDLVFSTPGSSGNIVSVVVEDPSGLLSATLGSNFSVATYQGSTSNNDEITVTSGVLNAISGTNKFIIEFTAGAPFDRVRINLASGVLGVDLSSLRIYSVCYRNDHFEPICNIPDNQASQISGLLCVLCNVDNGIGAIDGDETTYSQLNVNVGVAGSVNQTFSYSEESCIGEELKLILENPGGLLDAAVLGNVEIEFLDAADNILSTQTIGVSNLQLLNGSSSKYIYKYTPTVAYRKVRVSLNGGLVGALASLRIYEVCQSLVAPPLAVKDTVLVCDGNSVTLHAQSASATSITWWDSENGGSQVGSGKFFQTPILTSDITYYLETMVDSSGCQSSERSSVFVNVVPEAPAPVLSQSEYTVYEGDGASLNPGPANVDFNFYSDRNGATILSTEDSYTIDSVYSDTVIYIQTNLDGCLSNVIDSVVIKVASRPTNEDPPTGESYCADSTMGSTSGVCALCGVFNPEQAVDGNDNTYSTLQTSLGLVGAEAIQTFLFSERGSAGDIITIVIEDPNALLGVSVGSNLEIETFDGTTANGDAFTVTSGTLSVIGGTSKYIVEFNAGDDFDRLEVRLGGGVAGVDLSTIRIYSACYRTNDFPDVCMIPSNQAVSVSGVLCLACNVDDPVYAIDGNDTTYSQLNVTLGVAGVVSQTYSYNEPGCLGEGVSIVIENPGGLLSAALLGNVSIDLLDAGDAVVSTEPVIYNNLQLLGSGNKYLFRFTPDVAYEKIRISLNGGLVGALSALRVYEICRNSVSAPVPVSDTILACESNPTVIRAYAPTGSTISWWDAETGGNQLTTGNLYTTPALTNDVTYYLETTVDSSGCKSAMRRSVFIEVVPEAPAPVLSTREYNVYAGDDIEIIPGPANVEFNFYSDRSGTNILATGTSYTVDSAVSNTKIYVQTNLSGCLSDETDSVMINILNRPDPDDSTETISACADSTFSDINGVCALCGVFDAENAVDGNDNTYSTLQTTLGLLGTDVSQTMIFPDTGLNGHIISLVVEDPAGLLAVTLGGNIQIETSLGNVSNNDQFTLTSGVVSALGGGSKYLIEFAATAEFDRVEVTLSSGILGADLSSLRIYSACFRNDLFEPVCQSPGAETEEVNACLGCGVANGPDAIDGNENTYSQLNVVLGLGGYVSQMFTFNEESCVGEDVKLILENPGGLLSVALLGDVELRFLDQSDNVVATETIPYNDLQLISGTNMYLYKFAPSSAFRKLEVRLNSGLVGALSGLRIYEVCRNTVAPPIPSSDTIDVCDGNSVVLQASAPAGTTISWWDAATGGSQLATGESFTTAVISTDVTYYLESTVDSSGCKSSFRNPVFLKVQPGAPDPVIPTDSFEVCIGDSVVIAPEPSGSVFNFYSDRGGMNILAAAQASYTVDSVVGSRYIYIRTNLNGCLSNVTDSVWINSDNSPALPVFSDSVYVCTAGDVTVEIPNPDPTLTYEWYDTISGGASVFSGISYTINNVTDTLTFYIESHRGTCVSSSRAQVQVVPVISPDVNITSGDTVNVCNGSDAILRASSRMTDSIKWYDAPTGGNLLGGGSPFTYPTNPDETVSVYAAAYLDAGGCESGDRAEVVIITGDVLDIDVAADSVIICSGDTATLTGISTSSGVTYNWYDSPSGGNLIFTGENYTLSPSGNTTVYLEANTASCTNMNRVPATVYLIDSLATPQVKDTAICSGTSTDLYARRYISGGTMEWYDSPSGGNLVAVGDTINTSILLSPVTYYVSLNLGDICNDLPRVPLNVNVLERPLATDIIVSDTTICTGDSVELTARSTDPLHTFNWYDSPSGGNLVATGATFRTSALNATTEYYVEAGIGGNCNSGSRARVTVTTVSQPDINLITDSLVACNGDMVSLIATTNSSSATIRWYDAPTGGNLVFTGGSYDVQVSTDTLILYVEAAIGGCNSGTRKEARVYDLSNLAMPVVSDTTICRGNSVSLTATSNLAGATPRWWDAPSGGNLLSTANTFNTPNLTSTTSYYVDLDLGSSVCPGLARTPVTVTVEDKLARPVVSCETVTENSITFGWTSVPGAVSYEVSLDSGTTFIPANTPPASHVITGLVIGESRTVIVRAVGDVPCQTSEESFPVICTTNDCPPITVDYFDELTICEGESADIILSDISIPGYGIIFNGNTSQDTIYNISPSQDTTISIVIFNTDVAGCDSLTIDIDINVNPKPQANFQITRLDSNYTGAFINTFRFIPDAPGAVNWFWNFGDGNTSTVNSPVHDYMNEGKYDVSLVVTNSYGCTDSVTIDDAAWVRIIPDFFIPNTFTPDGDGINDRFQALGENIRLVEMRVFNPYGNLVFSTTSLSNSWDGTFRGMEQPSGVYTYTIEVVKPNGNKIARNGTITLIR